jgi:hypothetical protein
MYDTRTLGGGNDGLKYELDTDAEIYYKLLNDVSKECILAASSQICSFLLGSLTYRILEGLVIWGTFAEFVIQIEY